MPAGGPPPESRGTMHPPLVPDARQLPQRWPADLSALSKDALAACAWTGMKAFALLHSAGSLRPLVWLRPVLAPLLAGACVIIVVLTSLLSSSSTSALAGEGEGEFHVDLWAEQEMLRHAESTYQENLARRARYFGNRLHPLDIDTVTELSSVMVPTYPCPLEERMGVWADGGKWICNMRSFIPEKPVIYSVGSNGEFTFERDISLRLSTRPFTFDPFLDPVLEQTMLRLPFLEYQAVGLASRETVERWKEETKGKAFLTLEQLMGRHNHSRIDVFKMDCEGCESVVVFDILPGGDMAADVAGGEGRPKPFGVPPIGQMVIEFHDVGDPNKTLAMIYHLERMGYRMFHVEPNAQHPECCTEISFIHENLIYPRGSH